MNQLTVRGLGSDLDEAVHRLAQQEHISLNKAALRLLRKGAGLADSTESGDCVGSSLDDLIGSWTQEHAEEMDAALADLATIDESAWE